MKIFIITGSLFMALTVLTGAFGAHSLKHKLSMENMKIFEKGAQYQAYHSIGLVLIGLLGYFSPHHLLWYPALFFIFGMIFFSGSLYILVLSDIKWLGMVTPLGGISFVFGWITLAWIFFHN